MQGLASEKKDDLFFSQVKLYGKSHLFVYVRPLIMHKFCAVGDAQCNYMENHFKLITTMKGDLFSVGPFAPQDTTDPTLYMQMIPYLPV